LTHERRRSELQLVELPGALHGPASLGPLAWLSGNGASARHVCGESRSEWPRVGPKTGPKVVSLVFVSP
jgi:hypothetical protein